LGIAAKKLEKYALKRWLSRRERKIITLEHLKEIQNIKKRNLVVFGLGRFDILFECREAVRV
jgi:isopentenyl diphosphate isomerase/L-lactate dehydrogenase-like FMN-dependent dehydrogenase